MVLPQGVLRQAVRGPVLVELKNGDTYSGTLAGIDHLMNLRLEDAIFTARSEYRFEKLKECMIRGQFVKFIRFPDEILEKCAQADAASGDGRGKGRRDRKGAKGGKGSRQSDSAGPTVIAVPSAFIGMIIGRGGEMIRRFSTESGAQIEVAKDHTQKGDQSAKERNIFLRGSTECVDRASEMIAAFVREKAASSRERQRTPQNAAPSAHALGDFLLEPLPETGKGGGKGSNKRGGRGGKSQAARAEAAVPQPERSEL